LLDKIKEEKGDEAAEDFKKRAAGGVKVVAMLLTDRNGTK
jgi:hypothetical protein